ncbi:hypothetical protein Riv7116_1755 [Rivularia sp. PCC 7116]|nr:hypothetical protein Riv7116_1755 [Rivularia sp. PCC 7116]
MSIEKIISPGFGTIFILFTSDEFTELSALSPIFFSSGIEVLSFISDSFILDVEDEFDDSELIFVSGITFSIFGSLVFLGT